MTSLVTVKFSASVLFCRQVLRNVYKYIKDASREKDKCSRKHQFLRKAWRPLVNYFTQTMASQPRNIPELSMDTEDKRSDDF